MNIVLGSAFLLLTGIFYILVSGEKGNRKQKGARWIQRWGRKHGWQLPEWMTEECIWQTELAVMVAGVLLIAAGVTEQAENGQEISQLRRPAYGQGIQEENLEVEWRDEQGNRKKESMTVDVIEKQLSEKEIETIFSEVRGAIEKEILGENESLKHVDHPLYLREELQAYPVTVRWFSSRPEILDWEGKHGENIREDGEAVTLTAIIGLQGKERNESWDILVFPEISDEKRQVEDMVEKANADTEKGSEWMRQTSKPSVSLTRCTDWCAWTKNKRYCVLQSSGAIPEPFLTDKKHLKRWERSYASRICSTLRVTSPRPNLPG